VGTLHMPQAGLADFKNDFNLAKLELLLLNGQILASEIYIRQKVVNKIHFLCRMSVLQNIRSLPGWIGLTVKRGLLNRMF
jgi:hypothetical protein